MNPVTNTWMTRYVEAIKPQLPADKGEDLGEEIASLLEDKLAEAEADKGAPLSEDELLELIRANGHPRDVAAGYRPQRPLIAAEVMPDYLSALKWSIGIVVTVMLGLMLLRLDVGFGPISPQRWLQEAIRIGIDLSNMALVVFAIVTLIFSGSESARRVSADRSWDPRSTLKDVRPGNYVSIGNSITEIVLSGLFILLINGLTPLPASLDYEGLTYQWLMGPAAQAWVPWLTALMVLWIMLSLTNLVRPYRMQAQLMAEIILNGALIGIMVVLLNVDPLVVFSGDGLTQAQLLNAQNANLIPAIQVAIGTLILIGLWDLGQAAWRLVRMKR